jgi:hypothetical protein
MIINKPNLAGITCELNDLTAVLEEIWTALSRKLAGLNLGFDVWLDDWDQVFGIGPQTRLAWVKGSTDVFRPGYVLGFTKLDDEPRVVCRHVAIHEFTDAYESEPERSVICRGQPLSILDANRKIQLRAVAYVGLLLEKIEEIANQKIAEALAAKDPVEEIPI